MWFYPRVVYCYVVYIPVINLNNTEHVAFYLLLAVMTTRPLQKKVEALCGFAAQNGAF